MNLDSAREIAAAVFSDTYAEARRKFLAAAPKSRAYPCGAKGPLGEALFTDAAYFGVPDAKRLLIVISATHGVEGYCGSAGQLLFLQAKFHEQLSRSTAVLLIHALNSYGFAWDRRVTAEGVDLNRNCVDFNKPLPQNVGYEELADHLVPADISEKGARQAEAAIAAYRSQHGELKYTQARSGGQYTRPGGMFYGGSAPTEARRILEAIVADFDAASRKQVLIIDYHTGMGPYGYGEPQCEQPSGQDGYERAAHIYGPSTTAYLESSSSIFIPGSQDAFWERALGDRHTYIALEFGTYPTEFGANPTGTVLRDDHWLFKYRPEEANSELGRQIRQATKRHFYPQVMDWKEMIIWRSHQVHRQAMHALASE
jgi:hypothetical protein